MITSEGKSIENDNSYLGFPTLINFTPDTIFNELYKGLNKINKGIKEGEKEQTAQKTNYQNVNNSDD